MVADALADGGTHRPPSRRSQLLRTHIRKARAMQQEMVRNLTVKRAFGVMMSMAFQVNEDIQNNRCPELGLLTRMLAMQALPVESSKADSKATVDSITEQLKAMRQESEEK